MFTTIQARIFLKEKISSSDIINILLVFAGIIFIVKPPFIFGQSEMYTQDPDLPLPKPPSLRETLAHLAHLDGRV